MTYSLITLARAFVAVFDLLALVMVGLLASAISGLVAADKSVTFLWISISSLSTEVLIWLAGAIVGLFMIKSLAGAILVFLVTKFLANTESRIAMSVAQIIFGGSLGAFKSRAPGEIQWAAYLSPQHAITSVLGAFSTLVGEGALLVGFLLALLWTEPQSAVILMAYLGTVILFFQRLVSRKIALAGKSVSENSIRVSDSVADLATAFREIKTFGKYEYFIGKFRSYRQEFANGNARHVYLSALPRYVIETVLILGVFALLTRQLFAETSTDGLSSASIFLVAGVRMMGALLPIQHSWNNLKFFVPQARLAYEVLELGRSQVEHPEGNGLLEPDRISESNGCSGYSVSVRELTFTHVDATSPVLKSISLEIPSGAHVALVGPSGAGKTSLAEVILGLNLPTSGEVLVDGVDIGQVKPTSLGKLAYVAQRPGLIAGTLIENIALGEPREAINEERVWDAIRRVGLGEFAEGLSMGLHTEIGKQVDSLSGGERQRIGLARAIYSEPRLLVLDEATSNLDMESEAFVIDAVDGMRESTTVISIAHRVSTAQRADKVFVIDAGSVVASGTFSEVRSKVPLIERYIGLTEISD